MTIDRNTRKRVRRYGIALLVLIPLLYLVPYLVLFFLVCGALGLIAQTVGPKGLRDWLNWYIPIVLIFIAFRFTKWYPQQVREQQQSARAADRKSVV